MSLDDIPPATKKSVTDRLRDARWTLVATASVLFFIALSGQNLWTECVIGFVIILVVTLLAPRRGENTMPGDKTNHRNFAWPDAGMKSVCDALGHPAYILDRDAVLRYANVAATQAFGQSNVGDPISFKFRRPDIVRLIATGVSSAKRQEIEYHDPNPPERWYRMLITPIPRAGQQAEPYFHLLSFIDLTETKRVEQMRSDFVANASHELRTPLASLRGFIETIQGPAANDPKSMMKFLTLMLGQAERMSRLIDDLLSLSKIEMKAHLKPVETVDMVSILRHVADSLRPLADNLGVELHVAIPQETLIVNGDRDELIQVFENLVENACKYGQSGKKVDIETITTSGGPTGNIVRVVIRDYGPGIPEKHLPRLTERFYRVDVESSREKQGTGLGLAIVKHILTRHGTRLSVSSTIGQGAAFSVDFPVHKTGEPVEGNK